MLDSLAESLKEVFKKITRSSFIDKDIVEELVKDIQRALLKADVKVQIALEVSRKVKERALSETPPPGMSAQNFILKIVYEELASMLGKPKDIKLSPQKIMLVGLYGHGKTTTAGKLGRFFQRKGLPVYLVACDTHRPGAVEQLEQIGNQLNIPVFSIKGEKDPVKIVENYLKKDISKYVSIFDTSGRHSLDKDLIDEMKRLKDLIKPEEIFLIIDATIGQQAEKQALAFKEAIGITGVIITKLDGSAKGGGALSAVAATGAPVVFIGVGEHLDDLEYFDPKRFIARILGLGDIKTLMEITKELDINEEKTEKTVEKMMSGKINLKDMYEIWEQISRPGILQRLFNSLPMMNIPGSDKINKDIMDQSVEKIRKYRIILDSMTDEELENPDIIKGSRITRIARGAGVSEEEVRALLKDFNNMVKMMKGMKGNRTMIKMLRKQMGKELNEDYIGSNNNGNN